MLGLLGGPFEELRGTFPNTVFYRPLPIQGLQGQMFCGARQNSQTVWMQYAQFGSRKHALMCCFWVGLSAVVLVTLSLNRKSSLASISIFEEASWDGGRLGVRKIELGSVKLQQGPVKLQQRPVD